MATPSRPTALPTIDSTSRVAHPPLAPDELARATQAARQLLYQAGHRHALPRGGVFFCQGDAAGAISWVLDGRVMLSVVSTTGREVIVGVAGPGEMFGETALDLGHARTTTAIALEPAHIVQVDAGVLASLARSHPEVGVLVLQSLLARMADLQDRLAEQMMHGSEARLVHVLLLLASAEDGTGTARLPRLSQEVLARMVGTTRSRVNRLLRGLRDFGVEATPAGIRVTPDALRRWQQRQETA